MEALGVHVHHHQLAALGAEDHLPVGQPLGAEHLVDVLPDHPVLADNRLCQRLSRTKVGGKFNRLEFPTTTSFLVGDDIYTVGRDGLRSLQLLIVGEKDKLVQSNNGH